MAPSHSRKRKSDQMATPEVTTPAGSPPVKKMKITESQKQALIDNLQLEITERARRLRAQYALQCQDLRTRIERRVNRIPLAMRNMTMAELISRQDEQQKPAPAPFVNVHDQPATMAPPPANARGASPIRLPKSTQAVRSKKRKSSEIHIASDKENDAESNTSVQETLPVQKNAKRAKTNPNPKDSRTAGNRGGVLSPRSHNSRTLPRSPIKDKENYRSSPAKASSIARPVSPVKPMSPFKSAASAATSAISASVHGIIESARQRGAAALNSKASRSQLGNTSKDSTAVMPPPSTKGRAPVNRAVSQMSNHSASTEASTSSNTTDTTVVTKPKRGKATTTTAATKSATAATAKARKATAPTTTKVKPVATAPLSKAKTIASTSTKRTVTAAEPGTAGKRALRKRT